MRQQIGVDLAIDQALRDQPPGLDDSADQTLPCPAYFLPPIKGLPGGKRWLRSAAAEGSLYRTKRFFASISGCCYLY
jgi:hypothetical protein